MKILITGSEGFVGRHMMKRYPDAYGYDLVNGDDVRDAFKLDRLFESEGFDAVIHLAARAGVRRGENFPEEYFSTNVLGLNTLIRVAEKYGVKKFIHFSSSSVFGAQRPNVGTKETDKQTPKSIYGITKMAGELLLKKSTLPYIIVRPFTIIGEEGRKEMVIYKWKNQIEAGKPVSFYGDGSTSRGYTYIGDMLDGVDMLLRSDIEREDFNLGGRDVITLDELWQIFKTRFPEAKLQVLPMPATDQPYSLADTSKIEALGWKPTHDTKSIIQTLL